MISSWGRGALNFFFRVEVCGLDLRSVGLVNWSLPLKRGSYELKPSKFGVLWTENFPFFFLVVLWTDYCLKWDPCELWVAQMGPLRITGEARKGGIQGRTSPYPLSRSVPPPPGDQLHRSHIKCSITEAATSLFVYNIFMFLFFVLFYGLNKNFCLFWS